MQSRIFFPENNQNFYKKNVMIKIQRMEDSMRKNNYIYNNNYISISVCLTAEIDTIL